MWGTIYATMTTIGLAVLSAVLLLVLKLLMDQAGLTVLEERFFISSTTHAFIIATLCAVLLAAAPVSRYISDCIFLGRESDICPSAFGVLTLSTIVSGIVMFLLCVGMYYSQDRVAMSFLVS